MIENVFSSLIPISCSIACSDVNKRKTVKTVCTLLNSICEDCFLGFGMYLFLCSYVYFLCYLCYLCEIFR